MKVVTTGIVAEGIYEAFGDVPEGTVLKVHEISRAIDNRVGTAAITVRLVAIARGVVAQPGIEAICDEGPIRARKVAP